MDEKKQALAILLERLPENLIALLYEYGRGMAVGLKQEDKTEAVRE